MKLQHLRSLVAVYESGSLQRATTRLHISQPALTRTLQTLESELGVSLLVRSNQGVSLTRYGLRLIEHARRVLEGVDRARRDIEEMKGGTSQQVSIGITAVSALSVSLQGALADFHARFPDTRLRIHESGPAAIAAMLREGALDFAISTHEDDAWHGLEVVQACHMRSHVSVRHGHPLAADTDLAAFHQTLWVTPTTGPGSMFQQYFEQHGMTPPGRVVECASPNLVLDLMMALDAVALAPQLSPRMLRSLGQQVRTLRLSQRPPDRPIHMITPQRALLPSSAAMLFELVHESLRRQHTLQG